MKRVVGLDIFRGYAIALMVVFHFSFDLNYFQILHIDIRTESFWIYFRWCILSMFVFSAGISLKLAHYKNINPKAVKKRVLMLLGASLLVSFGSYTQFPDTWIYFGVLHFMLVASLIGLVFLRVPKLSLLLAIAIFVGYYLKYLNMRWLYELLQPLLHLPSGYTEDLVGLFPWFGVFLLGMVFASYKLHNIVFDNAFFNSPQKTNKLFSFFGRHSLVIYLIHQPILFALVYIYSNYL